MGYFRNSFIVTFIGLGLGAFLGWQGTHTIVGAFSTLFIVSVLAILEISLSFDNAVVNATVLKEMSPLWRHRFLTWGIAIAVFGMRIVFPWLSSRSSRASTPGRRWSWRPPTRMNIPVC